MLTSRELVSRAIRFQGIDRLPHEFPEPWGNDYHWVQLEPSPDDRRDEGPDDWGVLWRNRGHGAYLDPADGRVISDWKQLDTLRVPDIAEERRWVNFVGARQRAGDLFMMAHGCSIYERVHMLRGIEDTWCDITESPDELCRLLDILVEMNLYLIKRYATLGVDGFIFNDDWGLQDRLMIRPAQWRALWKPRYARIFGAARAAGLHTFLHSCGYIVDILDDLIEVGLQVIHMDQQENMGLELLGKRFGGRIAFFSPVDIQKTMVTGSPDQIRAYCRQMAKCLGRPEGGFLPRKYSDHVGAGHTPLAIKTMCDEFMRISDEMYPRKSGG